MARISRLNMFLNKHSILKKIIRFLFFKVYFNLTSPIRYFFRTIESHDKLMEQINIIKEVHNKTFGDYKNKYFGKEIAIFATGPSLNKYKIIPNVINIGVNKSCLCDTINLDYFFASDYMTTKSYLDTLNNYKNKNLQIFLGVFLEKAYLFPELNIISIMPESKILELNAKKYYLKSKYPPYNVNFNTEIDKTWIVEGGSVIFAAMQFALFTNPKRIYLVGCDCSSGYFDEKNPIIKPNKNLIKVWKELKKFAETYYPDTELVSVNPVGLKGVFKDLYQDGE